jgi:molybdate transport system substrate-binding protein
MSKLFPGFVALAMWCAGMISAPAQTPIPAQPVDPTQAIPAQPVAPQAHSVTGPESNPATLAAPTISITVLADSSLRNVLQELAQTWADNQPTNPQMPLTLTNAATMRTQLESNPTWDVVISADMDDMKAMTDKGLLAPDGQHSLARNTLVIYGRKALVKDDELDWFDLVGTEWKKVALGNPDLTASGRAARRALQKHDLFNDDHKKIWAYAPTEATALQIAERDQADAVFVYRTDLAGIQLPGFDVFPLSSVDAPPIFYTAAVGRLAKNPDAARAFAAYCGSEAAREIWAKYGFEMN